MLSFIGFQQSGKSTIGKKLAKHLNWQWIDTDAVLESHYQMPIKAIYQKLGEKDFRDAENQVILDIKGEHLVVSTGGGGVLREENMLHLKQYGKIIFLNIFFETYLRRQQSTPLFSSGTSIEEVFHQRQALYQKYADMIIENDDEHLAIEKILVLIGAT